MNAHDRGARRVGRGPAAIAALLAVALLGAACSASERTRDETEPAPEGSASTDSPPPGLAEFYNQELTFEPCAPYATNATDAKFYDSERFDCARVEVPLDYDEPDGARGKIALLRLKARGDAIGSLLVNPGGPGGSGMTLAAAAVTAWDASVVGERFDIIGFDPRGVGASTPAVNCYTDAEADRNDPPAPYLFSVRDQEEAKEVAQRCVRGTGGVRELTSVGSANVVRDMDVLREVLGDEQLNYLGYSYGSELGAMYAETFPDNVRALVVDGAVHPGLREAPFREGQYTAIQRAFDEMATGCAKDAGCPLGSDPSRASQAFHDLVRPLQDRPMPTKDGRPLRYEDVLQAVQSTLLSSARWPVIVDALSALAAGSGDPFLALRDEALGRAPDGRYGAGLHFDANLAIRCMDNPRTPAEQGELLRHARDAAPFLGLGVKRSVYECSGWPRPVSRDIPWATGDGDLPPTLTVSVTRDPGTPHDGGIAMARLLGGSLLTVEGAQHGAAFLGGSPCVDDIVADYLVDLETPPDDATCQL